MGIANKVTLVRIVLAPVLTIVLLASEIPHHALIAAALFVVAISTDLVDGRLARAYGQTSRVGGLLDGLADKLLWNLLLFAFVVLQFVPFWFAVLLFTRDALATEFKSMAAAKNVTIRVTSVPGKAKVALQNVGVGCMFVALILLEESVPISPDAALWLVQGGIACFAGAFVFGLVNFYADAICNLRKVLD